MKKVIQIVFLAVVIDLGSAAMAEVNIETVHVGNPGNAADTEVMSDGTTGYGAVNYEYNIGKYEVTAGQYCEFLNAVAKTDTFGLYNPNMNDNSHGCQITQKSTSGNFTYDFSGGTVEAAGSTAADWQDRPVNYVSWYDTLRFANWLTNGQPTGSQENGTTETGSYTLTGATSVDSLPDHATLAAGTTAKWLLTSENEWYKAAYHKNGGVLGNYYDYPTSSDSRPSNDFDLGGNNATFYDSDDTIGSPYWRTEVGAHKNSDSPYGTFDQDGNVWEWNEAMLGSYRGLRGGAFPRSGTYLPASYRHSDDPTDELSFIGVRVASVPEPATLTLLTLGSLALVRRRKLREFRYCEREFK
jgi:formylglycine-generating enzyme